MKRTLGVVGALVVMGLAGASPAAAQVPECGVNQYESDGWSSRTLTGCDTGQFVVGCETRGDSRGSRTSCGLVPQWPTTSPVAACGSDKWGGAFGGAETQFCTAAVADVAGLHCARGESYSTADRQAGTSCAIAAGSVAAECGQRRHDGPEGVHGKTGCEANQTSCALTGTATGATAPAWPQLPKPQQLDCAGKVVPLPALPPLGLKARRSSR